MTSLYLLLIKINQQYLTALPQGILLIHAHLAVHGDTRSCFAGLLPCILPLAYAVTEGYSVTRYMTLHLPLLIIVKFLSSPFSNLLF